MLFLLAAGLTLVLGIMNMVNLAHGSLYMVGAYLARHRYAVDRLLPARRGCSASLGTLVVGMLVEVIALRTLYDRDHLDQVLATFGLILFFNELVAIIWGRARALQPRCPSWLQGHIELFAGLALPGLPRSSSSASAWSVALALWYVVTRTRLGMLIRAGASQPHHGRRARRQHPPALHGGVRLRRGARRPRRPDGRARSTRCSPAWAS